MFANFLCVHDSYHCIRKCFTIIVVNCEMLRVKFHGMYNYRQDEENMSSIYYKRLAVMASEQWICADRFAGTEPGCFAHCVV